MMNLAKKKRYLPILTGSIQIPGTFTSGSLARSKFQKNEIARVEVLLLHKMSNVSVPNSLVRSICEDR